LFRDEFIQSELDRTGFVIVPLLDSRQVARLTEFYRSLDRGGVPTPLFHYSMDHPDSGYVRRAMDELIEVVGGALLPKLHEAQVVTASFVVKKSDPRGVVPPHQDWTFVDETRYRSFNVWTPLVDVDIDNGALGVIHGSYRFFGNHLRASPSPQCKSVISDHLQTLFPFLDVKPLRAGEAIIFDNATIHGSPPNVSGKDRLATGLVVTHAEAELRHHYQLPNTRPPEIETYAIDRRFFMSYGNEALSRLFNAGRRPEAKPVQRRPYALEEISREDLLSLVQSDPGNRYHDELVQRVQAAFGSAAAAPAPSPAKRTFTASAPVSRPPSRAAAAVGRFYDDHHKAFLQVYGNVIQAFRTKNVADLLDYQVESMGLADGQRVLDAGCGVAGPAMHFARARNVEIEAVTVSDAQFRDARGRIEEAKLADRIRVTLGDYHALDEIYPHDHFDLVYMLESFGHSHDKPRLLEACLKVLKPGGTLYVKDLFEREPLLPAHIEPIRAEIEKINRAYRYNIADLYDVLRHVRRMGFILSSLKTVDLPLDKFENLTISNVFQELTGIARIDDWAKYIFPVEFYEMKCVKPEYAPGTGNSRYFLQNLYHMQVLGTRREDL
jgi:ubiquinone/menaquinone biosynthesis C-methylase UbiE